MADTERRNLNNEFAEILTPKDCGRYSKTAKSNYEDAISKLNYTLDSLNRKYNNAEYTKYQPPVDDKVLGYYESVIGSFKSAVRNFVNTGKWEYRAPSVSLDTLDMFNAFMDDHNKHGSYFDGRPETVSKTFEKVVKNLTKNGFSASDLSGKKDAEVEAKKPKIEKVSYERFDSYDPNRMADYKASGRGEQMGISAFLTDRVRTSYEVRRYEEKYPEIREYFNKLFTAIDNAWFSYVSGQTKSLDFKEADEIYKEYTEKYSSVRQFDNKVCAVRMASGGSYTYWNCKDALWRAEKAREKVVKTITMEKENTYETWEKSIDSILNEDGKPSLNTYLENWVEEAVIYFTNKENIQKWEMTEKRLKKKIDELNAQLEKISKEWWENHKNDSGKGITWSYRQSGYKDTEEYKDIVIERNSNNSVRESNLKELNISRMGETKIRKFFKEQAADAKKSFVTSVCEKSGPVKDGVFYWSTQNTGHLNGTVTGETGDKWRITSFFAGGYNIQRLHVRTKITKLAR